MYGTFNSVVFKISCVFLVCLVMLGMDKTIQRGDLGKHGILFKIVPMHSEMKPSDNDFMSCWYKPLPKWLPRAGQSVIPTNLSEFKVCWLDDLGLFLPAPCKCSRTPHIRVRRLPA